jgi:hypothetical protein
MDLALNADQKTALDTVLRLFLVLEPVKESLLNEFLGEDLVTFLHEELGILADASDTGRYIVEDGPAQVGKEKGKQLRLRKKGYLGKKTSVEQDRDDWIDDDDFDADEDEEDSDFDAPQPRVAKDEKTETQAVAQKVKKALKNLIRGFKHLNCAS